MSAVKFDVTRGEKAIIIQIALRADRELFKPLKIDQSPLDTQMDLCATIAQGVPLRLQELLGADELNFAHDVGGIRRHINRQTGKLENCFLPRFYDSEAAATGGAK